MTLGCTTRRDDDSTEATVNDFDAHIPWVTAMILVYVVGIGADAGYGYRDRPFLSSVPLVGTETKNKNKNKKNWAPSSQRHKS